MYHLYRPKISFALTSLEPSELIFRIIMNSMNQDKYDVILFFEHLSKAPSIHLCSNMHIAEAYGFPSPVIATDLKTAAKLITFPSPKPKFFFINDLEWLRYPHKQFDKLHHIYGNPELTLLARSNDHKIIIENCWNRPVEKIIPSYNFFEKDFMDFFEEKVNLAGKRTPPTIEYKSLLDYL